MGGAHTDLLVFVDFSFENAPVCGSPADEPMHTLSPGVNISECDWFCLEPFGVNWLGPDCQECRNAQCHFDVTTGNDRG